MDTTSNLSYQAKSPMPDSQRIILACVLNCGEDCFYGITFSLQHFVGDIYCREEYAKGTFKMIEIIDKGFLRHKPCFPFHYLFGTRRIHSPCFFHGFAAYIPELLLLFLAVFSPGLCLRPGQVRKGGRERHGAGAVHKMAGLHLGLPDIH